MRSGVSIQSSAHAFMTPLHDALITHCPLTTMPSIKENTILMCSGIKIYVHVLTICKLIFPMAMGFYSMHVRT